MYKKSLSVTQQHEDIPRVLSLPAPSRKYSSLVANRPLSLGSHVESWGKKSFVFTWQASVRREFSARLAVHHITPCDKGLSLVMIAQRTAAYETA